MDKVRGGTPKGGSESLCKSCRNAHIAHGVNNQEIVLCRAKGSGGMQIRFPIVECSEHDNRALPALYEMEQIAWTVKSRNRGPMGFTEGARTEIVVEPPNRYGVPQESPTVCGGARED